MRRNTACATFEDCFFTGTAFQPFFTISSSWKLVPLLPLHLPSRDLSLVLHRPHPSRNNLRFFVIKIGQYRTYPCHLEIVLTFGNQMSWASSGWYQLCTEMGHLKKTQSQQRREGGASCKVAVSYSLHPLTSSRQNPCDEQARP